MNNFEKRFFLECFEKLLPEIPLKSDDFEELFKKYIEEFNVQKNIFKKFYGSEYEFFDVRQFTKKEIKSEFIKTLNSQIQNEYKKIKIKTCLIERQLLYIKDILNLSDKEYNLFNLFFLKETNELFESMLGCYNRFRMMQKIERILQISHEERIELVKELFYKSLIKSESSEIEINDYWFSILNNNKYNTKDKIIAKIMGKPQKSNLKITDFSHIKDEADNIKKVLISSVKRKQKGVNVLLYGHVGTGKTEFAKLIANLSKIPMYSVKTQKNYIKEADRGERLVDLATKQFVLKNSSSCILFDEAEDVMNTGFSFFDRTASKGYLNHLLENFAVPVIWTTNNIEDVDPAFLRRMTYAIEFEKLPEEARLNIWKRILRKNKIKVSKSKLEELNASYDVSPSIIANAATTAKNIDGNIDDVERFIQNIAKVVYKKEIIPDKNSNFKKKEYDINLVNTDLNMDNLTEKIQKAGKLNFSLCLYGEPGTGKSLYAKYLADKIGVEVVMKKASDLMSCYVGGTEKNIARAFAEAKDKKAMLIIDEADSFLQNRNNAHNSWEITQVNEMLTCMESHQYPFVCTTNLINSLDEASLRRFTFKVKFDFLSSEQVNLAVQHFFGIKNSNINIKGLTAGDFATVKKKIDFLGTNDIDEITQMLEAEVKVKKSSELQNSVGF
ncbi:ATP-binding protein [bacterium]|nr:ATP-binding protein [bacterium]